MRDGCSTTPVRVSASQVRPTIEKCLNILYCFCYHELSSVDPFPSIFMYDNQKYFFFNLVIAAESQSFCQNDTVDV